MTQTTRALSLLGPQGRAPSGEADAIRARSAYLADALKRLERLVTADSVDTVATLKRQLADFAVDISMVGQVKAGKTALTNALIGRPGLLPSDVNPWTSVVTSVHMNTTQPKGKDAVFTFFSSEEWAEMVEIGGHLGEMAVRANHKEELVELRKQIIAMQERTKKRLGRNFNMLLDGYHSFLGFTPEMVSKYVCLGDEDENPEGRYADVTKSAELYIPNEKFKLPTIVSDTPGVNDPFLLREAVTLDNLTETDICVIVLSAHQAFSSVDIALLRILMALKSEQLVIFINRIDELQNPDQQMIEIDTYVRELLEEQNLPNDLPIVFGSAAWATAAETGEFSSDHTEKQLLSYADTRAQRLADDIVSSIGDQPFGTTKNTLTKTDDLSGLHELRAVLEEKSAITVTKPVITGVRQIALDLAQQSLLYLEKATDANVAVHDSLDYDAFVDELDTVLISADKLCARAFQDLTEKVLFQMSNAFREFTQQEARDLDRHLNNGGKMQDWTPDTERLRRELNLAHDAFADVAPKHIGQILTQIGNQIEVIYSMVLDDDGDLFAVRTPEAPGPKTPKSLMRTMAIDMNTGWLTDWFTTRFRKDTYVKKFEELCQSEMQATLKDMQATYITAFEKDVRSVLHAFIQEHIHTLQNLSQLGGEAQRKDALQRLGVDTEIQQRIAELEVVIADLEDLFERPIEENAEKTETIDAKSVA